MHKKSNRKGFSLIEVIAAVIILAVVATATVATIAPMREKSRRKLDRAKHCLAQRHRTSLLHGNRALGPIPT